MRKSNAIILSLAVLGSAALWADPRRDEFQDAYGKQLKSNIAIFNTAPVYHIIPVEHTITFAGEYRYQDVRIVGPGVNAKTGTDELTQRLDLAGWSASPYIAFSAKRFGFGFAAEVGKRSAHFVAEPSGTYTYSEHLGTATYSGLGANLFWTPGWSIFPKYVVPTFILGGKSLNVKHASSGTLTSPYTTAEMTNYQYTVQNYQAGCNLSLKLLKSFTVIPWIDYSTFKLGTPELSAGASDSSTPTEDPSVSDDARLFWKSAPTFTYGVDFAVRIFNVNIHLGSAIGFLGTLSKGSDRIQDKSRSFNLSIDMKGN